MRYLATGDAQGALAGSIAEVGTTRFAIDRVVSAAEFFLIEGWILGPQAHNVVFEVAGRRGLCSAIVFRRERFDVNDAYTLPRTFPHDRIGFRIFGRQPLSAGAADEVLGLSLLQPPGPGQPGELLCTAPLAVQSSEASDLWRPLGESIRAHMPTNSGDVENAILLLNQLRSRDDVRHDSVLFPGCDRQAIDILILARHRPEIAEMNATLVQQGLAGSARIFVAALDWNASRQIGKTIVSLPPEQRVSLQYLVTTETLPSSVMISSFLQSNHAPSVAIVMDDVFIGPCIASLTEAIGQQRSLAVPRVRQIMLTPSVPAASAPLVPAAQAIAFGHKALGGDLPPLGALVLEPSLCAKISAIQNYHGRGLALEEIFKKQGSAIAMSGQPCLDLLAEGRVEESDFLNSVLIGQVAQETSPA